MILSLEFLDSLARTTLAALLSSFLPGMVLAALMCGMMRVMRRANATTRYVLWATLLLTIISLPLLCGLISSNFLKRPTSAGFGRTNYSSASAVTFDETLDRSKVARGNCAVEGAEPNRDSIGLPTAQAESLRDSFANITRRWFPTRRNLPIQLSPGKWPLALFGAWLLVSTTLLTRLSWGYIHWCQVKRRSAALTAKYQKRFRSCSDLYGIRRRVTLTSSCEVTMPMVIGLGRPSIIIPADLTDRLTNAEFDQVMLHELAHIRRWDDWTKLAQRLAEAVFFFHPAVLWIARQMNLEREIACDAVVISVTSQHRSYATCLTRLAELRTTPKHVSLVTGVLSSRGQLSKRIEVILKRKVGTNHVSRSEFSVTLGLLTLALVGTLWVSPFIVLAKPANLSAQSNEQTDVSVTEIDQAEAIQVEGQWNPSTKQTNPSTPLVASTQSTLGADTISAGGASVLVGAMASQGQVDELQENQAVGRQGRPHGYIDEMAAAGLTNLSPEQLTKLKMYAVTGDYIRSLRSVGYSDLSAETLASMSLHDVTPAFVLQLRSAGYEHPSVPDLIAARNYAVGSDFIKSVGALGYSHLPLRTLIKMRIQKVTPEYVAEIRRQRYGQVPVDALIRMRIQGIAK